jgi:hypothetical protein
VIDRGWHGRTVFPGVNVAAPRLWGGFEVALGGFARGLQIADGKWQMAKRRCLMADGKWQTGVLGMRLWFFLAESSSMQLTTNRVRCKYNVNTLHGHYIYN